MNGQREFYEHKNFVILKEGVISKDVNWTGGSRITYSRVEKSMFEVHSGIICLAENALNGKLAKLVATQLEYDYQPENEYFCMLLREIWINLMKIGIC